MKRRFISAFLLSQMIGFNSILADDDFHQARHLVEIGSILPLEQVLTSSKKELSGRILEVELEKEGEAYIYEIELLQKAGIVKEVKIDAATGAILKTQGGE
jgi:uncharacterized membrane protein YkoI